MVGCISFDGMPGKKSAFLLMKFREVFELTQRLGEKSVLVCKGSWVLVQLLSSLDSLM